MLLSTLRARNIIIDRTDIPKPQASVNVMPCLAGVQNGETIALVARHLKRCMRHSRANACASHLWYRSDSIDARHP
jgi:hypothetical protein